MGRLRQSRREQQNPRNLSLLARRQKNLRRSPPISTAASIPSSIPTASISYFLSARDFNEVLGVIDFEFANPKAVRVYAVTLRADTPSPFAPQSDEVDLKKPNPDEKEEAKPAAKEAKKKKARGKESRRQKIRRKVRRRKKRAVPHRSQRHSKPRRRLPHSSRSYVRTSAPPKASSSISPRPSSASQARSPAKASPSTSSI